MREILFRGKRTDNGEWVKGHLIADEMDASNCFIGYVFGTNEDGSPHDLDVAPVDPETICQYTGLTDKNGKKIFEGDIVTVPNDDELYSVIWDEDTASWSLSAEAVVYNFDNFWGYELEVVSNVYDNPDWLEV